MGRFLDIWHPNSDVWKKLPTKIVRAYRTLTINRTESDKNINQRRFQKRTETTRKSMDKIFKPNDTFIEKENGTKKMKASFFYKHKHSTEIIDSNKNSNKDSTDA